MYEVHVAFHNYFVMILNYIPNSHVELGSNREVVIYDKEARCTFTK